LEEALGKSNRAAWDLAATLSRLEDEIAAVRHEAAAAQRRADEADIRATRADERATQLAAERLPALARFGAENGGAVAFPACRVEKR
jgi:outer membrane murein-binding lipoprotein Lpp